MHDGPRGEGYNVILVLTSYLYLRQIRKIRQSLDLNSAILLSNSLAQMSKSMKVKVKHVQGHLYIVLYRIISLSSEFIVDFKLAAISILDILIGFGVMAERLNPYVGIFDFWGVFRPP